nr:hypothetical protein CTI12_AA449470 [Tanacetum cinerariifolium]
MGGSDRLDNVSYFRLALGKKNWPMIQPFQYLMVKLMMIWPMAMRLVPKEITLCGICIGYGLEEAEGREALEKAFAEIKSIVIFFTSHLEVIGITYGDGIYSLKDFGFKYQEVAD